MNAPDNQRVVAWRYRARRPIGQLYADWTYTDDAAKIARLSTCTDDDGGRLTNERIATWVIEALVLDTRVLA